MRSAAVAALSTIAIVCASNEAAASDVTLSGSVAEDARGFLQAPQWSGQSTERIQPTFLGDAKLSLEHLTSAIDCDVNPYVRYDSVDEQRRLVELHTAKCRARGKKWTLSLGYDVESWGVLEFVNPADVLNQRDLNDDVVTKRKLGQPMASLSVRTGAGTFAAYGLAWFTPLSFPGVSGRLRPEIPIDADEAKYQSSLQRAQPEAAFRYGNAFRKVEVNASYFYGYRRDPDFGLGVNAAQQPYLFPTYALEHQGSLELQATLGSLLLKSESVFRLNSNGSYNSAAAGVGFEYDLGTLLEGGQTISVLCEYDYDTRTRTLIVPFTDDLIGGVRIALNDVRATELTVWSDLAFPEGRVQVVAVDASTRILDGLKATVGFRGLPAGGGPLADLHKDEYVSLRLSAFF
jgi:hypothetical protein